MNTEQTETTEVEAVEPVQEQPDQGQEPDTVEQPESPGKAARYRQRAQAAEADLEAATARYDALLKQHIEQQLPEHISPKLLWMEREPGDFTNEDGILDTEKLTATFGDIETEFGVFDSRKYGPVVPAQKGGESVTSSSSSFSESFKPNHD